MSPRCFHTKKQLIRNTDSGLRSPQGWPCCHHHPGQICRKEGKFLTTHRLRSPTTNIRDTTPEFIREFGESLGEAALMEKIAGRDHSTPRLRQQEPPIPSRPGRRNRALPIANHPPYVEDSSSEAQQGQAFHQGHQLQPLDAHPLHARVGGIEGCCHCRYFQGAFPARGCEEDRQEGIGGAIHVGKEQMVLHSSP